MSITVSNSRNVQIGNGNEATRYPYDPYRAMKARSYYWRISPECEMLRVSIKTILMHPKDFRWTVQGFGFLRAYLPFGPNPKRFRLNVWDNALTLPNVSIIHDHPWDFTSWIISGEFVNVRYVEDPDGDPYEFMRIKCGELGGSTGTVPAPISLRPLFAERYMVGDIYQQRAHEIHQSVFESGTVTINDRAGDTEHPRVFWKAGAGWVDAKPREATESEVAKSTALALEKWQDGESM